MSVRADDVGTGLKRESDQSVMSREIAAGFSPDVLTSSSVLLTGVGAGGSNAALPLALMGIGRLLVVDYDVFEPSNAPRSPLYPDESERHTFGMGKARVLAHKIQRLAAAVPGRAPLDVRQRTGYVQSVPLGIVRECTVVANGSDNAAARAYAAEQAFLAGRPFVDAAFSGELVEVAVFVPDETGNATCWRCHHPHVTVGDPRRYACGRSALRIQASGLVPATQPTAQVAGALEAYHIALALHGEFPLASTRLSLDIRTGLSQLIHLPRNPACPSHWHRLPRSTPIRLTCDGATTWRSLLAAAEEQLGPDIQLQPLARIVEVMQCASCERPMDVRSSAWLYEAQPTCTEHGGPFPLHADPDAGERFYDHINGTSDFLDRRLANFGWYPGDLLIARTPDDLATLVELVGDSGALVSQLFQAA